MYKFKTNRSSFSDFGQPVEMEMSQDNRWVKKSEVITLSILMENLKKICHEFAVLFFVAFLGCF